MFLHSLLIVGCTIATAAGKQQLGYDLNRKSPSPSRYSAKRDLFDVGIDVKLARRNDASATTTIHSNSTVPSNSTDTSCGQLMAASQHLNGDGMIPAPLAYKCLMSIPFHQEDALFHIETLLPYIGFHSDLAWVADPPEEYAAKVKAPFDVLGCIETVRAGAESGSYTSEYLFSLDLQTCFASVQDQHFGYTFDMAGGLISFGRSYSLVSASSNGECPAAVYLYADIDAAVNQNATFEPSCIVKINGEDAVEFLLKVAKKAPIQDPDAAYNYLFGTPMKPFGYYSYENPLSAWYPGPNTTYELANGTLVIDETLAFLADIVSVDTSVQTGEDFYRKYIKWSTQCDAGNVGAVSMYEYSVCHDKYSNSSGSSSNSDSADSPPAPAPREVPSGFPAPVASLNDTDAWGFFLDGEDDVAVLVLASFADKYEAPFDPTALAEFLGDFIQQAADAKRTKLVIDLSQNLGGFEDGTFQIYSALFPDLADPIWGGRAVATDALDLLGQEYSYTLGVSDPDSLNQIAYYRPYNYRQDLDLNGNNFTSWEQKFGPQGSGPAGTPFTPYWRSVLSSIETPRSPFTPENTVLLTDGIIGSSGATFAELLILQARVRTVVVGGRPGVQQMQTVGATRSFISTTFLSLFQDVAAVFLEGKLHQPSYYKETVLNKLNVLPVIRSKANALALQLSQDPTDPSLVPMMYKYQPADFHIPYTFENVLSAPTRWKEAAAKVF